MPNVFYSEKAFPVKPAIGCEKNSLRPSFLRFGLFGKDIQFPSTIVQFWSIAARQAGYNLQNLSRNTGIHVRQIERFCRSELGRTPQEWMNEQRIIAARTLLLETESIKGVAIELGFKQLSHFCRQFKQAYGMKPSEFLFQQKRRNLSVAPR